MSDFLKSLASIQMELKAPKGQYNSFGKYAYRSCEDILEAVKPLLAKHGLTLMLMDKPVAVGSRIYIEATAKLMGGSEDAVEVTAYAREPDDKKGMDASQITGTASSYARKYALNGLFLIDDTKDADTDEYKAQTSSGKAQTSSKVQTSSKAQTSTEGAVEPVICPKCGKRIADYPKPDGTIVPAQTVYDSCGHMCLECFKKNQKSNTGG